MEVVVSRLQCAQIPDITILGLGSRPTTTYVAHMQSIIGHLLKKLSPKAANSAMHSFLGEDAGKNMAQGGDLVTAYQKGPLTAKIYTHQLGTDPKRRSYFVTQQGVKDIVNLFSSHPNQEKLSVLLLPPNTLANHCEVLWETSIESPQNKKRRAMELATEEQGVYVLRFNDGQKPLFYVGKSSNIEARLQQHASGQGAACAAGREFTRVACLVPETNDIESWERGEVLERMYQFGIDAVRGWKFTFKGMPLAQKVSAFDDVCERFDLCRKCGRGSHFVRECEAMTTDRWAGGLELRSSYPGASAGDEMIVELETQVQNERNARIDAERRNAEAVRILLDRQ